MCDADKVDRPGSSSSGSTNLLEQLKNRWLKVFLGCVVSLLALWLALRRVQLQEFAGIMQSLDVRWLCLAMAVRCCSIVTRGARWQVELRAVQCEHLKGMTGALALSSFFNIVIPLKMGELLRMGYARLKNPRVLTGQMVASIAVERLLDMAVIAGLVICCWTAASAMPGLVEAATILMLVTIALFCLVASTRLLNWVQATFFSRMRLARFLQSFLQGSAVVRNVRLLFWALIWTAAAWLVDALALYCVLEAVGLDLSFDVALIVLMVMAVGLLVPSAPVQLGTHQALAVFLLGMYGASEASAVATSVVFQGVTLLVFATSAGLVIFKEPRLGSMLWALRQPAAHVCTTTQHNEVCEQ